MNKFFKTLSVSFLSLLLGVVMIIPASAIEKTEIDKFDEISEKIELDMNSESVERNKIISYMEIIDIDKFNIETEKHYESSEKLAIDVYEEIQLYASNNKQMLASRPLPIYEGGLNFEFSGWNYNGAYLDYNNTNNFIKNLKKAANDITLAGVISTTVIGALTGLAGAGITGVVSAWNLRNVQNAVTDLEYYNGPRGTRTTTNKFTGTYQVRSQNNRCISNCPGGSTGGGSW